MNDIREVKIDDIIADVFPLLELHRDEISVYKELMTVNPDLDKYYEVEKNGNLLALAAYDGDILIGYSISFIGSHLHYSDLIIGNNDVLFVKKEYRESKLGYKLITLTTEKAKERGAKIFLWHAKDNTALSKLLSKMKYIVHDVIFSKVL